MASLQDKLMAAIADTRCKRNDVARAYARCITAWHYGTAAGMDWPMVNRAIMDRWSENALHYIKGRAWRIVYGRLIEKEASDGE